MPKRWPLCRATAELNRQMKHEEMYKPAAVEPNITDGYWYPSPSYFEVPFQMRQDRNTAQACCSAPCGIMVYVWYGG